jgi:mono/diheme cytochrome c family protein
VECQLPTRFALQASSFLIAFIALSFSGAFAQASPPASQLTANPVFHKNCAKCHGKSAEGRRFGGPSLVSGKATAMSEEDLRNIVTNGKGRMPKYAGKLSSEEIETLVRQITDASHK